MTTYLLPYIQVDEINRPNHPSYYRKKLGFRDEYRYDWYGKVWYDFYNKHYKIAYYIDSNKSAYVNNRCWPDSIGARENLDRILTAQGCVFVSDKSLVML